MVQNKMAEIGSSAYLMSGTIQDTEKSAPNRSDKNSNL